VIVNPFAEATARPLLDAVAAGSGECPAMVFGDEQAEGSQLTEDELRAFCRGKIASYKIPIVVRFVKDVPRTPGPHGEKVQRAKLREQAIKETAP
jgi:acyl-CoA synthetase (AMP-forming)/AMP-acid ligase II